ncbi:MAG TPA: DUF3862 domain-containing protein [Geobacteraceae bacterium]
MIKRCLCLVALVILLGGCSKLTKKNYDKLKMGMAYDEVVAILGKPDNCSGALVAKNCVWGDEHKNITVNFIGDRVILYLSKNIE